MRTPMGYLIGFQEYLDETYNLSIFDSVFTSKKSWNFHIHSHRVIRAKVTENLKYDLKLDVEGSGEEVLPKTDVKLLYPSHLAESIQPLIKTDTAVKDLGLEPIISPRKRHHIKNKNLFPLMKEKSVVFFTLLEGEILRGIIAGFSRYEIVLHLKGGLPAHILRHCVYDLRDKKGRCFLKSFQETHRDWEKSDLFVPSPPYWALRPGLLTAL
jgi:sRNA-binding regulator protein Hfq